ncbi:MAG: hypothetical protein AB1486_04935 [Planctomycetota bacterium]
MAGNPQKPHGLDFQRTQALDGGTRTIREQIRQTLRSAPWIGVSVLLHVLGILICFNIPWSTFLKCEAGKLSIAMEPDVIALIPKEELPPPTTEVDKERLEAEEPLVEESVAEPPDEQAPADPPLEGKRPNDVIGLGGGAGPGFGEKYRPRGKPLTGTASQRAVDWGLDWLHRHQHEQGYWGAESFQDECAETVCAGTGHTTCDVGVTGLALLAFLGAGNTPSTGRYGAVVRKGLHWLKKSQGLEIDGLFGDRSGQYFMYNHAIATLATCEGYGLSHWPLLKEPAQDGLHFIAKARNPYEAWRYSYPATDREEDNDVSVTGWMLFALVSGKDFGLQVDEAALAAGSSFIDKMTDQRTWRTGYDRRGGWSAREPADELRWPAENGECMTAVAILCRILLLEDKTVEPDTIPAIKGGALLLGQKTPEWTEGAIDYYYWYYGSYAMYQLSGWYWDKWQRAMEKALIQNQAASGCEKGSWDPLVDPWGDVGGRVYATALNVLSLEVYYRYDRIAGARG